MTDETEVTPESGGGEALTKRCPRCGETKTTTAFSLDNKASDKLKRWCRQCSSAAGRLYRERNPSYAADMSAQWRREFPERRLLAGARWRAKNAELPFDLTEADIVIPALCPVLNIPLVSQKGRAGPCDSSPSLDRLVPELGYVKGNVLVISQRANRAKSNLSLEELEAVASWLSRHVAPAPTSRRRAAP